MSHPLTFPTADATGKAKILVNCLLAAAAIPVSLYVLWGTFWNTIPVENQWVSSVALLGAVLLGYFRGTVR